MSDSDILTTAKQVHTNLTLFYAAMIQGNLPANQVDYINRMYALSQALVASLEPKPTDQSISS